MKSPIFACAGLVCVLAASNSSAHAVVLEQKWQAGNTLTYNTNLSGNVNLQIPAGVPFFLAGIPLEVEIEGKGKTLLETLRVDEAGTGTIAVKVPNFTVDAKDQTFGIPAKITLLDGKTNVTVAGKPQEWGKNWGERTVPTTAIKIAKNGRITGFEPIAAKVPAANSAAEANAAISTKVSTQSAIIGAMILQALPALLPAKDVQKGDQWNSEVKFAGIAKTDEQTGEVLPLGKFDMTLKGQETVAGKSLWRIGVKGQIEVDSDKVNALSKKVPVATGNNTMAIPQLQLQNAKQTVDGDIWFDAQAGQISNAELILNSISAGKAGKAGAPSWFDFTGTLQMKLADKV